MTGLETVLFLIGCYAVGAAVGWGITKTPWFKNLGKKSIEKRVEAHREETYGDFWRERGEQDYDQFDGTYHFDATVPWIQKFYDEGYDAARAKKEAGH